MRVQQKSKQKKAVKSNSKIEKVRVNEEFPPKKPLREDKKSQVNRLFSLLEVVHQSYQNVISSRDLYFGQKWKTLLVERVFFAESRT